MATQKKTAGTLQEAMQTWLKEKNRTYSEGLRLLNQFESTYKDFLEKNKGAKRGEYAFNLLENRIRRAIRILAQQKAKQPQKASTAKSQAIEQDKKKDEAK